MSQDIVLVHRHDDLVTVTLNRPESLNALSRALRQQLTNTFRTLATDPSARVVILTGAGRGFCAGIDLKELGTGEARVGARDPAYDVVAAMSEFPGPIIGAINGAAVTGGFEIALACDLLIASPSARFADTHGRVGMLPGWGLSQRLPRLIGMARAKEASLTGNFIDAATAERWGLVNRVVAADQLLPTCERLGRDMLGQLPEMLVGLKRIINDGCAMNFGDALTMEASRAAKYNAAVDPNAVEARRRTIQARGREQM
jgi:enoyl-CoA hydratase